MGLNTLYISIIMNITGISSFADQHCVEFICILYVLATSVFDIYNILYILQYIDRFFFI